MGEVSLNFLMIGVRWLGWGDFSLLFGQFFFFLMEGRRLGEVRYGGVRLINVDGEGL